MAETQEEEDVLLPHQEVLEELDIDLTSDLNAGFRLQVGRIEKNFQKAIEAEDEDAEKKVRAQSKALANSIIKFIDDKKASDDLAERYNNLVGQADTEFKAADYETARATYLGALELKPAETYPQNQINLIEKAMAESKANDEQAEKYDSLVNLAKQKVKIMDFDAAKDALNKALELYPGDVAVTKALADIEAHLANPEEAKPISDNKQRVLDIITDLEATYQQNGKITHEDILDSGIEQYPAKEAQFQVGDPNKHGKSLILVKTQEGEYSIKKKSNKGMYTALGVAALGMAVIAAFAYFTGRKRKA